MSFLRLAGFVAVLVPMVSLACGGEARPSSTQIGDAAPPPPARAESPAPPASGEQADEAATVAGTVAETMSSGGYTYARLTGGDGEKWIAAPEVLSIKVGDELTGLVSMPMERFRSRTLDREFDRIYFVSRLSRGGEVLQPVAAPENMTMAGSHGLAAPAAAPARPVEPVAPAPGGLTVADVWARRAALSGKAVLVRARVVKANYEIMGVNWYHLQDGSGAANDGTSDLTVTSDAEARVGEVVTISGTLVTDKDFGAGYAYEALVEKATIRR